MFVKKILRRPAKSVILVLNVKTDDVSQSTVILNVNANVKTDVSQSTVILIVDVALTDVSQSTVIAIVTLKNFLMLAASFSSLMIFVICWMSFSCFSVGLSFSLSCRGVQRHITY